MIPRFLAAATVLAGVSLAQSSEAEVAEFCNTNSVTACVAMAVRTAHHNAQPLDVTVITDIVRTMLKNPYHPGHCHVLQDNYNTLARQIRDRFGTEPLQQADDCSALAEGVNAIAGHPVVISDCAFSTGTSGLERCYRALEMARDTHTTAIQNLTALYAVNDATNQGPLGLLGLGFNDLQKRIKAKKDFPTLLKYSAASCAQNIDNTSTAVRGGLVKTLHNHHKFVGNYFDPSVRANCVELYSFVNSLGVDFAALRLLEQELAKGRSGGSSTALTSVARKANLKKHLQAGFAKMCDTVHERLYGGKNLVKQTFNKGKCRHQYHHGAQGAYGVFLGEWYYEWFLGRVSLKDCKDGACQFVVPTACYHSVGKLRPTCSELAQVEFEGDVVFDGSTVVGLDLKQ